MSAGDADWTWAAGSRPRPGALPTNISRPHRQTAAQQEVEHRILAAAGCLAPRLGRSRRDFLRSSGGMALSLLAMNAVFGRVFDVLPVQAADPAAVRGRTRGAVLILHVAVHYVGSGHE